jgi:hypothetical protein
MADENIDTCCTGWTSSNSEVIPPRQIEHISDQSQRETTRSTDERKSFAHPRHWSRVADHVETEIRVGANDDRSTTSGARARLDHQFPLLVPGSRSSH